MGRAQPSPRVRQVGFSTFVTLVHLHLKAVGTNGEKAGQPVCEALREFTACTDRTASAQVIAQGHICLCLENI